EARRLDRGEEIGHDEVMRESAGGRAAHRHAPAELFGIRVRGGQGLEALGTERVDRGGGIGGSTTRPVARIRDEVPVEVAVLPELLESGLSGPERAASEAERMQMMGADEAVVVDGVENLEVAFGRDEPVARQ